MKLSRSKKLIQGMILASMASLMVAGFLLMGGFGSAGSAEAKGDNCRRLSLLRCQPRYERTETITTRTLIAEQ